MMPARLTILAAAALAAFAPAAVAQETAVPPPAPVAAPAPAPVAAPAPAPAPAVAAPAASAEDSEIASVLAQIRAELDAYEQTIAAEEAAPPQPGTAAAALAQVAAAQAEVRALEQRIAEALAREVAATDAMRPLLERIIAAWTDLPGLVPAPAPAPAPAGVPAPVPQVAQVPAAPAAGTPPPAVAAPATVPGATITAAPPAVDAAGPVGSAETGLLSDDGLQLRVLSRPGALLHARPGDGSGTEVPVFSVLYVFDKAVVDGKTWLQVGASRQGATGWIQGADAETWKNMLVMRYAPASERSRVLFFRQPDDILEIIEDFESEMLARDQYARVADGTFDPDKLVAIEPARSVNQAERPYLMPILDWRTEEFDSGYETTLLQLAGLNLDNTPAATRAAATVASGAEPVVLPGSEADGGASTSENLTIGVAFVIDTTRSMGPYLERAKTFVKNTYAGLAAQGLADRFRFGLVGYRDNVGPNADIGYVTRIYRDLDADTGEEDFKRQVFGINVSSVSTENWREDAFAGLEDAILGLNWGAVDARMVFLITDASARDIGDPLARDPSKGAQTIADLAVQNKIALFILHMQTEEAAAVSQRTEGYDDHKRGVEQYARMQVTGNQIDAKYFRVGGATEAAFETALDSTSRTLVDTLAQFRKGEEIAPARATGSLNEEVVDLLSQSADGMAVDEKSAGLISTAVVNEVFRAQQEYLGARDGVEAPAFYRAWAADRDLIDPRLKPFEVSVFMTRAQISNLAQRLDEIVGKLDNKDSGLGEFFKSVQERSGRAVVDPQMKDFLPSYLEELPYRSKFLSLSQGNWDALGAGGQEELLREVRGKLASYRQITASEAGWLDLGDRSPEEQVYPMPLRNLP